MVSRMRVVAPVAAFTLVFLLISAELRAQVEADRSSQPDIPRPASSQRQSVGLPQLNPVDKMLALELTLADSLKRSGEDDWAKEYAALYREHRRDGAPERLADRSSTRLALALGVKASDGVVALKARDVEALNECAEQIEALARALGAEGGQLAKGDQVKRHADQGQWPQAFMGLAFLQHDVMRFLEQNPERHDEAVAVIVGGWIQAGACITDLVLDHYTGDLSNILREPRTVALLQQELEALPADVRGDPLISELIITLPEIKKRVDVGLQDPVPEEDVRWLNQTFLRLVDAAVGKRSD